jgi:hypothetical protein
LLADQNILKRLNEGVNPEFSRFCEKNSLVNQRKKEVFWNLHIEKLRNFRKSSQMFLKN